MKKIIAVIMAFAIIPLFLVACGSNSGTTTERPSRAETNSVAFMVDGERFQTARVKVGQKITSEIGIPTKEGYTFIGWYLNDEEVDLDTFVPSSNVYLEAKFEKLSVDDNLNVNDTKQEGKDYYLVVGWWECTKLNSDGTQKLTSYLTEDLVKSFYANVIFYVAKAGATPEDITKISFRNYSSEDVASMGALVNQDGDVDIMIGVGNNINSTAGVALYEESNDSKFQTTMGSTPTARYVALLNNARAIGVNLYDWLRTDTGKTAFTGRLKEADITVVPARTNEINLTVTVHGDTDVATLLDSEDDTVSFTNVTVPSGKEFVGFAKTADGEVVLNKTLDSTVTYADLKSLINVGDTALDLYPVFRDVVVVTEDLVVYVQINGTNLYQAEAELLADRFRASLTEDLEIRFEFVEGNATAFTEAITAAGDADIVIGGNNPLNTYSAHADAPLVNTGAKHFLSTNRKVVVLANTQHFEAAKKLYDFVKAEAPAFSYHITFWENNHSWITADEVTAVETGIGSYLSQALHLAEGETLADKFNLSVTFYEAEGTKVAALTTETKALREGKGTDMIIACGNNVDDADKMGSDVQLKVDLGAPFVAATGRKIALTSEYLLLESVINNYFTTQTA